MKEPPIVCKPRPPVQQHYPTTKRSKWHGLLNSRPAMFGLLFGVTGFLGIPLLWMSESFSHTEKIVWSVIVSVYTLLLIGAAIAICWWSYSQISELLK